MEMAKISKSSMSFKIFEVPEDAPQKNLLKVTEKYEILGGSSLEKTFSDLGTENRPSKVSKCLHRTKPGESLESTTSTTPENLKLSTMIPNAPVKPPRTSKKADITPKRLQFVEEAENPLQPDFDTDCSESTHRNLTRANRNKISAKLKPECPKRKQAELTRFNSQKNRLDVDKENDRSLANGRKVEASFWSANQRSIKKTQPQKSSSRLQVSQNQLKPEGDFAHFRI